MVLPSVQFFPLLSMVLKKNEHFYLSLDVATTVLCALNLGIMAVVRHYGMNT